MAELFMLILKVISIGIGVSLCIVLLLLVWLRGQFIKLDRFFLEHHMNWFTFDEVHVATNVPVGLICRILHRLEEVGRLRKRFDESKSDTVTSEEKEQLKTASITLENVTLFEFRVTVHIGRKKRRKSKILNIIPGVSAA